MGNLEVIVKDEENYNEYLQENFETAVRTQSARTQFQEQSVLLYLASS